LERFEEQNLRIQTLEKEIKDLVEIANESITEVGDESESDSALVRH